MSGDERIWVVSFVCETSHVPGDAVKAVRAQIEQMGGALTQIPPDSSFWSSVEESGLSIVSGGWRFTFRINRDGAVLDQVDPALP